MSDDVPASKYDCLKNALANSGMQDVMPPIKSGTDVTEHPPWGSAEKREPPRRDQAAFSYEAPDGKHHLITAEEGVMYRNETEGLVDKTNFGTATYEVNAGFAENMTLGPSVFGDTKTGAQDQTDGPQAKDGTAIETAKKILKCRTPPMS